MKAPCVRTCQVGNPQGICFICSVDYLSPRITGICAYLSLTQRRRGRKGFYVVNWLHGLHRKSSWSPWSVETRKRPAWQQFHLWNHVDYLSPAYHANLRVFVCTQKARNTQNCDLFHSRSMRMKTFCKFCEFCVRYYFLVSSEGISYELWFINNQQYIHIWIRIITGAIIYIIMCRRPDVQNYYILSLPRGMVFWAKVSFQEVWDRCPRGCRVIL